jgi:hypothetical protein
MDKPMSDSLPNPYAASSKPAISDEMASNAIQPDLEIGEAQIKAAIAKLHAQQNLPMAVIAGVSAALIGAILWAIITVVTKFQIGYMAVGVGFLVGYAIRTFGKGLSPLYGVIGASLALIGCLLGNLLSVCGFIAGDQNLPFMQILLGIFTNPDVIIQVLIATFQPMDLLFYGIALYEGYHLSFRELTEEDALQALNA